MAAIITSTSTQFTLEHQKWWPNEHCDSSPGDIRHLGDKWSNHGDDNERTRNKHGTRHEKDRHTEVHIDQNLMISK